MVLTGTTFPSYIYAVPIQKRTSLFPLFSSCYRTDIRIQYKQTFQ
ncbi:hypothetical protein DB29_02827 [Shouchella clausii]|nr:hypothetical protein DB29_02827 [Shouchella clausii]